MIAYMRGLRAPLRKRYIFRLLIFERVSISLIGAYESAGESVILVSKRTTQGLTGYLFCQKRFIKR